MPRESLKAKTARARRILDGLRDEYPQADCALNWQTPWQLLVATILSAQCTDKRVNMVTPELFDKYPDVDAFAETDPEDLQEDIRSTGFFRNKAKAIVGSARRIRDEFDGQVPRSMDEMLTLPGVARKTANVVLGTAFGIAEGIVVDTHVSRLAIRLKLTSAKKTQGDKIEQDLMKMIDRDDWVFFAHALVLHGRAYCTARKPDCEGCPISADCPSAGKV